MSDTMSRRPKRQNAEQRKPGAPATAAKRKPPQRKRSNAVQVKPPPPSTLRGRATRSRLKSALAKLLESHSYHAIRLEDITSKANVRVSLFYHYFQSKTDITHEVLTDLLQRFRDEVATRPRDNDPLTAIHHANQRMVALYRANPGAMRCLLEVDQADAPFVQMWRELTREWNQRIAANIRRQAPHAFRTGEEYLSLAYALAGMVDSFLYDYFVARNSTLLQAHPEEEDVARFLTVLWYRMLYLHNPPDTFLERLAGFKAISRAGK
jgi:AcrR family transcriptional regulator